MRVLVLDDEAVVGAFLKTFLESNFEGCECYVCDSIQEFKRLNAEVKPDYYILDVVLLNGQVFSVLDQFDPSRAILVTGYASERVNKVAQTCGFHGVLPKPLSNDVLRGMLDSLRLKVSMGPQLRPELTKLIGAYPQVFNILARNLIDGQKVQQCVEIIGSAMDATVIVSPFEQDGLVSFPLFGYFKDDEAYLSKGFRLPEIWVKRLLDGEIVVHVKHEEDDTLKRLGETVERALIVPVIGEEIGNWGFLLTFDEKNVPYSREEIEFVKSFASVLALALLRLRHNTTLETVLRSAITRMSAH